MLSDEQIDKLEGDALAWAVGNEMGIDVKYDSAVGTYLGGDWTDPCGWYKPYEDANQALEVWAELAKHDAYHLTLRSPDNCLGYPEATVYRNKYPVVGHGGYVAVAHGDFCEAICRAYLKVRANDAD